MDSVAMREIDAYAASPLLDMSPHVFDITATAAVTAATFATSAAAAPPAPPPSPAVPGRGRSSPIGSPTLPPSSVSPSSGRRSRLATSTSAAAYQPSESCGSASASAGVGGADDGAIEEQGGTEEAPCHDVYIDTPTTTNANANANANATASATVDSGADDDDNDNDNDNDDDDDDAGATTATVMGKCEEPISAAVGSTGLGSSCWVSDEDRDSAFSMLHEIPGNDACVECQAKNPDMASTTYGIFICHQCSFIHRAFGEHISRVLSTTQESWSTDLLTRVKLGGNQNFLDFMTVHKIPANITWWQKYPSNITDAYKSKIDALITGEPWAEPINLTWQAGRSSGSETRTVTHKQKTPKLPSFTPGLRKLKSNVSWGKISSGAKSIATTTSTKMSTASHKLSKKIEDSKLLESASIKSEKVRQTLQTKIKNFQPLQELLTVSDSETNSESGSKSSKSGSGSGSETSSQKSPSSDSKSESAEGTGSSASGSYTGSSDSSGSSGPKETAKTKPTPPASSSTKKSAQPPPHNKKL
ncbi:Arf GTPase activating protein [Pelomyxa schiedti]|nr:Arf GTPase activating protein [Pelomyxa schiedti]